MPLVAVNTVFLLVFPLLISADTFYVKPNNSASCPAAAHQYCRTLVEYARERRDLFIDTSNTTFIFLPGDHILDIPIKAENVENFTLVSYKGFSGSLNPPSRIVCSHSADTSGYFYFNASYGLYIKSLAFVHCGGVASYSITLTSVGNFHLINCTIEGDVYPGLASRGRKGELGFYIVGNVFTNNTCTNSHFCKGGAIWAHQGYWNFEGNRFSNNSGFEGGSISAMDCTMDFMGETHFGNNSANNSSGGAIYAFDSCLNFIDTLEFVENSADSGSGGAIYASGSSSISFGKTAVFEGNTARHGGGLKLAGGSKCYFRQYAKVNFTNNHATYGGAVHISDTNPFGYCPQAQVQEDCFFQIRDQDFSAGLNSKLRLKNNSAGLAGDAVFGGVIDNCRLEPDYQWPVYLNSSDVFDMLVEIKEDYETHSCISSPPLQVCICVNNAPRCDISTRAIHVYPGETFIVNVAAVGQREGTVPANILYELDNGMDFGDYVQVQVSSTCTDIRYTVFTALEQSYVKLYPQGPCSNLENSLNLTVQVSECPTGFVLSKLTKSCICADRLQKYTNNCNITSQMIIRGINDDFWVGYHAPNKALVLHPHCPFDYCTSHAVSFTLINDTDLECEHNRSGLICGRCQPGLSLTLGSSRCRPCSNAYLALLLPFALAGFVLVVFLFICKLTVVVGDINGLVFYANVVVANRAVFFPSGDTNMLTLFVAWINLDLGVETCFYDGMDQYTRTWLQLVFPLYIWSVVGFIIIISKYANLTRVLLDSNHVAVLATLFLLSYAKILRVIFAALSFTTLDYPSNRTVAVWLYDGNIDYLHGKHVPLFLAALFLFLFIVLPYTLFLLLGQYIQSKSIRCLSWVSSPRLKSLLDAYLAPYTNRYHYWTGLLLLLRCILLLAFTINSLGDASVNLFMISASALGLQLWAWMGGRVYRKWYLDALEGSFIINLGLLAIATYHVRLAGGNQTAVTYVSVSVALITFVGIVLHHAILQIKGYKVCQQMLKRNSAAKMKINEISDVSESDSIPLAAHTFYYGANAGFREPLLDS